MAYNKQPDDMALDPELVELAAGNKAKKGKGEKAAEKAAPVEAAAPVKAEEAPKPEPKVACFISRKDYPISETVELKYRNQTVRVAKSFVKFQLS